MSLETIRINYDKEAHKVKGLDKTDTEVEYLHMNSDEDVIMILK